MSTEQRRAVVVTVGISNPDEDLRLHYRQMMFRPDVVRIKYESYGSGPWRPTHMQVFGSNVRKNGSLGQNRHDNHYFHQQDGWDAPGWLTGIANEHVPQPGAER